MCRHGIRILHERIRNMLRGCVVLRHCTRVRVAVEVGTGWDGSAGQLTGVGVLI